LFARLVEEFPTVVRVSVVLTETQDVAGQGAKQQLFGLRGATSPELECCKVDALEGGAGVLLAERLTLQRDRTTMHLRSLGHASTQLQVRRVVSGRVRDLGVVGAECGRERVDHPDVDELGFVVALQAVEHRRERGFVGQHIGVIGSELRSANLHGAPSMWLGASKVALRVEQAAEVVLERRVKQRDLGIGFTPALGLTRMAQRGHGPSVRCQTLGEPTGVLARDAERIEDSSSICGGQASHHASRPSSDTPRRHEFTEVDQHEREVGTRSRTQTVDIETLEAAQQLERALEPSPSQLELAALTLDGRELDEHVGDVASGRLTRPLEQLERTGERLLRALHIAGVESRESSLMEFTGVCFGVHGILLGL
jgi:hypothetical protein